MTTDTTATKDAIRLIPSGSAPDFAGDVNAVVQWLQAGRSFRKTTTLASLTGEADMEDNDIAIVNNIDGAWFKYDSSAATWRMYGVARFADSSARSTAIPSPVTGMRSYLADTGLTYEYINSAWTREIVAHGGGLVRMVPSSVAGTGVSVSAAGLVTVSAATAISVNGCFTSEFNTYRILLDLTSSGGAGMACVLRVSGTNATSAYDRTRLSGVGTTASSAQSLNGSSWELVAAAVTGRHYSTLELSGPAVAAATVGHVVTTSTDNGMSSAAGIVTAALQHRTTTAYDGFSITPSTGNFTGTIRIYGYA